MSDKRALDESTPTQAGDTGGAGGVDIEITPEMVRAGIGELTWFDRDRDSGSEFVTRLYRVMASNAPPGISPSDRLYGRQQQKL